MKRPDQMSSRDWQIRALDLAKEQGFPRVDIGSVVVEGKDGWLQTVHHRLRSQQRATVRLADPSTNSFDRAAARGHGREGF